MIRGCSAKQTLSNALHSFKSDFTAITRYVIPFIVALILTGCGAVVTPPTAVNQPIEIYIADYGKHSSLILPTDDVTMQEFAWGDFDWYARGEHSLWSGIHALLFSDSSGFGIHEYRHRKTATDLQISTGAEKIVSLKVESAKVKLLQLHLLEKFNPKTAEQLYYNTKDAMLFSRTKEHYWFAHNCNHQTADWLIELDCKVGGIAIFGGFRLAGE